MPAYLCSGDATQPTTPVWSPSVLTGSLRPAAVEGRRKCSQNTRFLTPSSGTCDGHTLWATWRRGPLGKRGTVSPRADALRTPSGPAGKRSSSPTRQPVLGPPRRPAGDAAGTRFLLAVGSHSRSRLYLSQQSRSPVTPARGPGSPSVTRRTTFEAFGKMANSLAPYPLSGTLSDPEILSPPWTPVLWKAAVKSVHTAARTHARTQDAGLAPRKAAGAPDRPAHVTASAGNRTYHSDFN